MIINCQLDNANTSPEERMLRRRDVYLDGKKMTGVWYVDTNAGIIKTYDIFQDCSDSFLSNFGPPVEGNSSPRTLKLNTRSFDKSQFPNDWVLEFPAEGAISRTFSGAVELRPVSDI